LRDVDVTPAHRLGGDIAGRDGPLGLRGHLGRLVVLVAVLLTVPGRKKRAATKAEWAAKRQEALDEWFRETHGQHQ
jgi:hypothetical protein